MRPRLHLHPGDTYLRDLDGKLTITQSRVPTLAELPSMRGRTREVVSTVPPDFVFVEDPVLALERALMGAVLVGAATLLQIDDDVLELGHRLIVDALAGVELPSGRRVLAAIVACRAAGVPPEIVGREENGVALGYLAGCARDAVRSAEGLAEAIAKLRLARRHRRPIR